MQGNSDRGPHTKRRTIADYKSNPFSSRLVGTLSLARSGVGFVTPAEGGADILVPEENIGNSLPGDSVEIQIIPPNRPGGRPTGRILRVLSREPQDVVCTLHREGKHWTAYPLLAFGNRTFNIPHPGNAGEGDRVVVRFSAWDNPYLNPDAEIVGIIGAADNPSLDTLAIEKAYHLSADFPEEVLREAQNVSARLHDIGKDRLDLRKERIVTIDPATARDYDDALSIRTDEKGQLVLGVHIADVSHFVREGSALDAEARKRGTSVYLIDHVLPMLPEQLSNGVCSLVQDEDRLAFSVFITFDRRGNPIARSFSRSIIRSSRRMTYDEALQIIETDGQAPSNVPDEIRSLVLSLHALAQQLRKNRFDRFSLDLASTEPKLILNANGEVSDILPSEHNVAHELVEEAMIAANEAVAIELAHRKIPHLCRFHDAPDPEKLEELSEKLDSIGLHAGDLSNPGHIVRLLRAVRNTGLEYYVSSIVLRAMKRAEYSAENEGHFGLAKRYYSHFTSPIRRYPDLIAHRQLALALSGDYARQPSRAELRSIAFSSTKTEFNATKAERDLVEIKKYRFLEKRLQDHLPAVFDGVVVHVTDFGAFIEVPALQITGMAHLSEFANKNLSYNGFRQRLLGDGWDVGSGTHVRVNVTHVDYESRHIDFSVLDVKNDPVRTEEPAQTLGDIPFVQSPKSRAKVDFGPINGRPVRNAIKKTKDDVLRESKAKRQSEKTRKTAEKQKRNGKRKTVSAAKLSKPIRPGKSRSAFREFK